MRERGVFQSPKIAIISENKMHSVIPRTLSVKKAIKKQNHTKNLCIKFLTSYNVFFLKFLVSTKSTH